jgi:hypothetical protein
MNLQTLRGGTMKASSAFYICPLCFYASGIEDGQHEHPLLHVDPGLPGDERRKPLLADNGRILNPAPGWFSVAVRRARIDHQPY